MILYVPSLYVSFYTVCNSGDKDNYNLATAIFQDNIVGTISYILLFQEYSEEIINKKLDDLQRL